MHLFYFSKIAGNEAFLDEDDARHCIKVLRKKVGEDIQGIDGKGNYFKGKIKELGKDKVVVVFSEKIPNWGEKDQQVICGISPLHKQDHFEWFLEKSVELGVTQIHPFVSERTVKQNLRAERMVKIMISAMKQCKRSLLPDFFEPVPFKNLLDEFKNFPGLKIIPFCEAQIRIQELENEIISSKDIGFLIGPEGDFTLEEVSEAENSGFKAVSFGETRLRSETAALHMLSLIKFLKQN